MDLMKVLIVDPIDGEYVADLQTEGERITRIERVNGDFTDILMPGFADVHTHGAFGVNSMTMDYEDLQRWEKELYREGITYFLPTTVSAYADEMNKVHEVVSNYIEKNSLTSVSGIHLEGPYINVAKKGSQNPSRIRPATAEELNSLSLENALLITMAPEIEGFEEALPILKKNGVVVSLGHTDAKFEDMNRASVLGINRMTHFPNGMNTLHHREIGCVGAGLLLDMMLEMISDGIHSSPDFVKLVYKLKGPSKIILITDSIDATGLEDGKYDLGGLEVRVINGRATLKDGTIAGSTLKFSQGVRNFQEWTNCSLKELAAVSSFNALRNLGIDDRGRIASGYFADFVLLDKKLEVKETVLSGQTVFRRK